MIDIRCSKDEYSCDGCPIEKECNYFENNNFVNLWEIYIKGKYDGIKLFANKLLEYDRPVKADDILDELMFFKESNNELSNYTND